MLKKVLAVLSGLAVAVAVFAADELLKPDHPDRYVVQKGDTLWDIAGRFLSRPWLWPEIWQANPQVENPHLIYPGDELTLVYADGRPILSLTPGDGRLSPRVRSEPLRDAITTIPLARVEPFLENLRIVDAEALRRAPYVVGLEENRLRASEGQLAYVRGLAAAPGTLVSVLRPTQKYTDVPERFPWSDSPRRVVAEDYPEDARHHTLANFWKRVAVHRAYRRHTEYLGHELQLVAQGEVLREGDPATVLVTLGDFEVRKGDVVFVGGADPYDLVFQPRPPETVPDNFRVIAVTEGLVRAGPYQVIALSKGARDGVENGQVYSIFHPGEVVRDDVEYGDADLRTVFSDRKAEVQLPEEFVGHVMVFRTYEKVSYGLIMDGIKPATVYDVLREPLR